ncbi:MAG: pentapeptide repeat-containing protein [Eubacteriales bacterium]|nr:pentapeptide repeat-containing protein [Eubacteriales bacterium]
MGQSYKIDRIHLITYKGKKKKTFKSLRCRYIAKSQIVNCLAQSQTFEYVNFRGSLFKQVSFKNAVFSGCDFWGATFNKCQFQNAIFRDCVFMACKFKDCDFSGATFSYSTIVNTNLSECHNIDITTGIFQYRTYPKCKLSPELENALANLHDNRYLRKNKLLYLSDKKYNELNIFLLQKRFHDKLPKLLCELDSHSTAKITTYKKLERTLQKLDQAAII